MLKTCRQHTIIIIIRVSQLRYKKFKSMTVQGREQNDGVHDALPSRSCRNDGRLKRCGGKHDAHRESGARGHLVGAGLDRLPGVGRLQQLPPRSSSRSAASARRPTSASRSPVEATAAFLDRERDDFRPQAAKTMRPPACTACPLLHRLNRHRLLSVFVASCACCGCAAAPASHQYRILYCTFVTLFENGPMTY